MKFHTKWRQFAALFVIILAAGACGSDDEKSEEEIQLNKLVGAWTMASVDNDGVDRSDEYPGMKVTLSGNFTEGGKYNMASTASSWPDKSPWLANDTWKFDPAAISSIIVRHDDTLEMTYTLSNSDSNLTIEFDYSGPGYNNGRTASVGGHWIFKFTRQ